MSISRRAFLVASGAVAGGSVAALASAVPDAAEQAAKAEPPELVVGACGICCSKCPAMAAGKCKGCGAGTAEGAAASPCPIRSCAAAKGVAFCGTDCKGFLKCQKIATRSYAAQHLAGVTRKMT